MTINNKMKAVEWNNTYPISQPVYLKEDDDSITATQTRSKAWDLLSGSTIIKVYGKTGGYDLSRIIAR